MDPEAFKPEKEEVKEVDNTNKDVVVSDTKSEKDDFDPLTTRIIDTNRKKIRSEVLLVCLGDSKGCLHFTHLYLD